MRDRPAGTQGFDGRRIFFAACAALLSLFVYVNALHNPFVYDDRRLIPENNSIHDLMNLRAIALRDVTRPMVNLSYAIDYAISGATPFGFHLTNLLLHALNVVLLFQLAWGLSEDWRNKSTREDASAIRPQAVAIFSALIFAVHPILTDAVGYIGGRTDVLCGTFLLLAFLCGRSYVKSTRKAWMLPAIAFWLAALATKEIAVMFPAILLCYDVLFSPDDSVGRRSRWKALYLPLLTFAVLGGVARVLLLALVERPGRSAIHWGYGAIEMDVVRRYLALMLFPRAQTVFHEVLPLSGILDPRIYLGIGCMAVILTIAWRLRRSDAITSFGLLWFLLLLMPSAALVMLNPREPMVERRVYVACAGLFLVIGSNLERLGRALGFVSRRLQLTYRAGFVMLVVWMCAHTVLRNHLWANPVELWLEATEKAPKHWLPRLLLGEALQDEGRCDSAVMQYRIGLSLEPDEPDTRLAYAKLGSCLAKLGRLDEAAAAFETLRKREPDSVYALAALGGVSVLADKPEEAKAYFQQAIGLDPQNIDVRQSLARLNEDILNNPSEALRLCREIEQLAPNTPGNDECISRSQSRLDATGTPGH